MAPKPESADKEIVNTEIVNLEMKINAWSKEVKNFFFEATDEQGRKWELYADFDYEVCGTAEEPKFKLDVLTEIKGRCVSGAVHPIVPSPKIMQALKEAMAKDEDLAEAEAQATADNR